MNCFYDNAGTEGGPTAESGSGVGGGREERVFMYINTLSGRVEGKEPPTHPSKRTMRVDKQEQKLLNWKAPGAALALVHPRADAFQNDEKGP